MGQRRFTRSQTTPTLCLIGSGDPTGVESAPKGCTFYWDKTGKVLYISETSGKTGWEEVVSGGGGGGVHEHVRTMSCASGTAVGDLVYLSTSINNFARKASDNNTALPIFGIVQSKPASTTAVVLIKGEFTKTLGRGRIFVSTSGAPVVVLASTIATGYLQEIGSSFGDGTIFFDASKHRIKRA